jgi:hypothetical protein
MVWARVLEVSAGVILLMAAASKGMRMSAFVRALGTYRLVTEVWAAPLGRATVVVEGLLGALLISERLPALALAGASVLFAAFATVGWIEARDAEHAGPRADCGCLGGVVRLRVGRVTVAMNVAVAAACLAATAAFAFADTATVDGELAASVWAAALPVAALYWMTSYAVSVIAMMHDDVDVPRAGRA